MIDYYKNEKSCYYLLPMNYVLLLPTNYVFVRLFIQFNQSKSYDLDPLSEGEIHRTKRLATNPILTGTNNVSLAPIESSYVTPTITPREPNVI